MATPSVCQGVRLCLQRRCAPARERQPSIARAKIFRPKESGCTYGMVSVLESSRVLKAGTTLAGYARGSHASVETLVGHGGLSW
jgi:hypothetical protein